MNRSWQLPIISLVTALLTLSGCGDAGETVDTLMVATGEAQGTTFNIQYDDSLQRDLTGPIDSLFGVIDRSLSQWVEGSSVNRLNSGDSVVIIDPHLFAVLAKAQEVHWITGTAFDPTVDTLMRFWGFRGISPDPDSAGLQLIPNILNHVGMGRMLAHFDWKMKGTDKAELTYAGFDRKVTFDPNGIAQGYTVDVIAEYLNSRGIDNYMVEVGGEVRAKGKHPQGRSWTLQIDKPVEGNTHVPQAKIQLNDASLATSGNYRKFREIDGKKYGHTIDPRTGYPVDHGLLSATVVTKECAIADALATAFMVMGADSTKVWLARNEDVKAYLIMDDGEGGMETWQSEDLTIE
jgi:thiamine biosynthesis lipoprotein